MAESAISSSSGNSSVASPGEGLAPSNGFELSMSLCGLDDSKRVKICNEQYFLAVERLSSLDSIPSYTQASQLELLAEGKDVPESAKILWVVLDKDDKNSCSDGVNENTVVKKYLAQASKAFEYVWIEKCCNPPSADLLDRNLLVVNKSLSRCSTCVIIPSCTSMKIVADSLVVSDLAGFFRRGNGILVSLVCQSRQMDVFCSFFVNEQQYFAQWHDLRFSQPHPEPGLAQYVQTIAHKAISSMHDVDKIRQSLVADFWVAPPSSCFLVISRKNTYMCSCQAHPQKLVDRAELAFWNLNTQKCATSKFCKSPVTSLDNSNSSRLDSSTSKHRRRRSSFSEATKSPRPTHTFIPRWTNFWDKTSLLSERPNEDSTFLSPLVTPAYNHASLLRHSWSEADLTALQMVDEVQPVRKRSDLEIVIEEPFDQEELTRDEQRICTNCTLM
mmetsp:Transcript_7813/g.11893  ORF Transcript_7813/g.11893 Transcript_7813/m.11893 type:complete len:444 (-) Transcript_7813:306-1637(-)